MGSSCGVLNLQTIRANGDSALFDRVECSFELRVLRPVITNSTDRRDPGGGDMDRGRFLDPALRIASGTHPIHEIDVPHLGPG